MGWVHSTHLYSYVTIFKVTLTFTNYVGVTIELSSLPIMDNSIPFYP